MQKKLLFIIVIGLFLAGIFYSSSFIDEYSRKIVLDNSIENKQDTDTSIEDNSDNFSNRSITEITSSDDFGEKVIKYDGIVFVDFYANWCYPCQVMAPIIDDLSNEYSDIRFVKVNVDAVQDLSIRYHVASIPFYLIFKNGEVKEQIIGAKSKIYFKTLLDNLEQ